MKKLILISLFILLFSVNCFAYDSTYYPSNALSYVATNNDSNFDLTTAYDLAYNYFSQSEYFNYSSYSYILPVSITRTGSSSPYILTYGYIGSEFPIVLDSTGISTINLARQYSKIKFSNGGSGFLSSSYDTSNTFYWGFIQIDLSNNSVINNAIQYPIQITRGYYSTLLDYYNSSYSSLHFSRYSTTTSSFIYCGNNDTVDSYYDVIYSKNGEIKEVRSSSSDIDIFTDDANLDTTEYSSSFYDLYITRNDLTQLSNGNFNFYKYTDLNVKFSDYFVENYGQVDNYSIFISVYNSSTSTAFIDNFELTSPYSDNVVSITINGNEYFLRNFHGYLDIYLYYSPDGGVTKLGETSYYFNITAYDPSSATLPNGIDNTITTTGNNGDIPNYVENTINIINNQNNANGDTTFLDGFESFVDGILGIPKYIIGMVRGIFSSLAGVIDLFRITFSWLPSEIVGIIFSGLMLGSLWIVIKAIRGG